MFYYPHMPIGMLEIYRLLFVFFVFFVCAQKFGDIYMWRGLTWGNEALQDGRSRSLPGHLPFW